MALISFCKKVVSSLWGEGGGEGVVFWGDSVGTCSIILWWKRELFSKLSGDDIIININI